MTSAPSTKDADAIVEKINAALPRIRRHQNAGRHDEANEGIRALIDEYGPLPQLLQMQASGASKAGDRARGRALLEEALLKAPDDVSIMVDLGSLMADDGDLDAATELFQQAVDTAPNYALARANLGAAQVLRKEYRKAILNLQKAIELDDSLTDSRHNLAQAYLRMGNYKPSVDVLFRILADDPQDVSAHVSLAHALYRFERHEAAEHHARRALELNPNASEAMLYLGSILASSGRVEEGVSALRSIVGKPGIGLAALTRLVYLRKIQPGDPELDALDRFEAEADRIEDRDALAGLMFARGKAAEDIGDYDAAITYFTRANDITAEQYPHDQSVLDARAARMREVVTPELITRHRSAGLETHAPIFICGMPRSGTTLTEQMFSRHSAVQAGGEMTATMAAFRFAPEVKDVLEGEMEPDTLTDDMITVMAENYVQFLHANGLRSEYVTDKMPSNYLYVGLLALAFPRARFLIMRRHPMDCLLSNFTQNFGRNQPFSTRFEHLAAAYDTFDELASYWAKVLPGQVREVPYEALVADPRAMMEDLLDFVGLAWEPAVLDHASSSRNVNTASVVQVRQPVYKSSVKRWQRYGPRLEGLALALRKHLTEEELAACGVTKLQ
ncbi:tetratricopeptide repeat-containing sulfotransferase family protein [Pseudaestuariivita atlantica]|uniref:Uncharacterized protein n=1 Tax=Pseudaestuariivita atlantica TaxID=1317121 RepID=A0A0L1JNI4_9RHOB|nr:tetratricopeptide repeat-containing sulfotransferase family protein [Pseudaestuariivita atlantica]KNG92938.1 hypothetical protein ATO11_13445 [Pseudaestuariivita atlantica]